MWAAVRRMDEYLRTTQLIDCTGQVTHTLVLQVDGSIKIVFPTGCEAVVDPDTRTCRTPGAQRIESPRSSGVHHPGLAAGDLSAWAGQQLSTSRSAYGQPFTDVFSHFCDHLVETHGLAEAVVRRE